MVPIVEFPPAIPFTCQLLTPLFCESLDTVGVNCWILPTLIEADVGAIPTLTAAVTVMVAGDVFVLSAIDVAVSVTCAGFGTDEGAA